MRPMNKNKRIAYRIHKRYVSDWHMSSKEHVIDIVDTEQAWINDKPFFLHQTRGAYKPESALVEWLEKTNRYLNE